MFPKSLRESILISGLLRRVLNQPLFSDSVLGNGTQKLECFVISISTDCYPDSKVSSVGTAVGFQSSVDSKG